MRTTADVQNRLRKELEAWFPLQANQTSERFYLYYTPTTQDTDGSFTFAIDAPTPSAELAHPVAANGFRTIEQNMAAFSPIINSLPILAR